MSDLPALTIAPFVTREHGERFAYEWMGRSYDSGAITEAFSETGVVVWPDDIDGQARYHEIENEIAQRVSDQLRSAAVETFIRVASEVLARERQQEE